MSCGRCRQYTSRGRATDAPNSTTTDCPASWAKGMLLSSCIMVSIIPQYCIYKESTTAVIPQVHHFCPSHISCIHISCNMHRLMLFKFCAAVDGFEPSLKMHSNCHECSHLESSTFHGFEPWASACLMELLLLQLPACLQTKASQ